jgi:hypothetical protein
MVGRIPAPDQAGAPTKLHTAGMVTVPLKNARKFSPAITGLSELFVGDERVVTADKPQPCKANLIAACRVEKKAIRNTGVRVKQRRAPACLAEPLSNLIGALAWVGEDSVRLVQVFKRLAAL